MFIHVLHGTVYPVKTPGFCKGLGLPVTTPGMILPGLSGIFVGYKSLAMDEWMEIISKHNPVPHRY